MFQCLFSIHVVIVCLKSEALVGALSGHCETSQRFVDSSVRHRRHLEPVHVFELSTLLDLCLWGSASGFGLGNFEKYFRFRWSPFCVILNYVMLWARLCIFADISAGEVDR